MPDSNQHFDLRERVLGQARDVLHGEANGDWRADWSHEWAQVLLDLVEQLQTAEKERDEWEKRYEELLSAAGGVWPG